MIYVIVHRPEGDAYNTYDGMTQDQVVAMAAELWPGATCEFVDQALWTTAVESNAMAAIKAKGVQVAPSSPA